MDISNSSALHIHDMSIYINRFYLLFFAVAHDVQVPVFNKKEDIFQKLYEDNVPVMRAAWFVKMTNAYNTAVSEGAKAKKRQTSDPFLGKFFDSLSSFS
jgi:Transcription mediator complex subunit Med12